MIEPTVEVRFQDFAVEAEVLVGNRGRPTILNSYVNFLQVCLYLRQACRDAA